MVPGSAVVALAIEHTWAIGLRKKLEKVGAEVALTFRIPAPMMEDALAELGVE
jgi:phosphoenolpyruvate carboxylase